MSQQRSSVFENQRGDIDLATASEEAKLEWVQLVNELNVNDRGRENFMQKSIRKFKENPLIPIGCLVTTGFLVRGLVSMIQGDTKKQQLMMRGRVGAQAFTIAVIAVTLVGVPYFSKRPKNE